MEFYLWNVRVVNADSECEAAWVHVQNGKVQELGQGPVPPTAQNAGIAYIDGAGRRLVPGFIDMHIHGGDGADVMDGSARSLATIARFHASHGTTGWLPTTLTAPFAAIERVFEAVTEFQTQSTAGAQALGVHLEGPFLSAERIGAQNPKFLAQPSAAACEQLMNTYQPLVRKMTIAPEIPGALDAIQWLHANAITPSLGHTDATYAEAEQAIQLGHCHATHLFNAMRGIHHREPGALTACLLHKGVTVELIVDGIHLTPEIAKLTLQTAGAERICLITDAMSAAGRPDGQYELGGLAVTVESGKAYLTGGHQIAGSTLTMDVAVRNMVQRVGVTLQDAVRMASSNPARELGLSDRKGAIAAGMDADLVLLDDNLSVVRTWVGGTPVFAR